MHSSRLPSAAGGRRSSSSGSCSSAPCCDMRKVSTGSELGAWPAGRWQRREAAAPPPAGAGGAGVQTRAVTHAVSASKRSDGIERHEAPVSISAGQKADVSPSSAAPHTLGSCSSKRWNETEVCTEDHSMRPALAVRLVRPRLRYVRCAYSPRQHRSANTSMPSSSTRSPSSQSDVPLGHEPGGCGGDASSCAMSAGGAERSSSYDMPACERFLRIGSIC